MGHALGHLFQNRGQTPEADRIFGASLRELIRTPEQLAAFMAADAAIAQNAQLQSYLESTIQVSEVTFQTVLHDIPGIVNDQLNEYMIPNLRSTNHRDNCGTHIIFVGCDTGLASYDNISIAFRNFVKSALPGATYEIWKIDNMPAGRRIVDCASIVGSASHIEDCIDLLVYPEKNEAAFEVDVVNSLVSGAVRSGCLPVRGLEEQIRYGVRNNGQVIIIANRSGVELATQAVSRLEPGVRAAVGFIQTGNVYPSIVAPGLDPRFVAVVNNCSDVAVRWSFGTLGPLMGVEASGSWIGGFAGMVGMLAGRLIGQVIGGGECKHSQADPNTTTPWSSRDFVPAYLTGEVGATIASLMRSWEAEMPCRQQSHPMAGNWVIPQGSESLCHSETTDCNGITTQASQGTSTGIVGWVYTEPLPIPKESIGDCSEPDYLFYPNFPVYNYKPLHLNPGANPWEFSKSDIKPNPDEDPASINARVKIKKLSMSRDSIREQWEYQLEWELGDTGSGENCYFYSISEKRRLVMSDLDIDHVQCTFERQVKSNCGCNQTSNSTTVKYQGNLMRAGSGQ